MRSKLITIFIVLVSGCSIFFILKSDIPDSDKKNLPIVFKSPGLQNEHKYYFEFLKIRDTIHVLGNNYILLSLKDQTATLYTRNDSNLTFKISSGSASLKEGINTPPGFFTVQSKSTKAISKQFDDAELFNWIGFNGNVGFHGLAGNGYYRHLGSRPSSHGCVRMSREQGKLLFSKVKLGTPVLVYDEEPAIYLTFASYMDFNPGEDFLISKKNASQNKLIKTRLNNLYKGLALRENSGRLFIDGNTVLKPGGYDAGKSSLIAHRQKLPRTSFCRYISNIDNVAYVYNVIGPEKSDKKMAGKKNTKSKTNKPARKC